MLCAVLPLDLHITNEAALLLCSMLALLAESLRVEAGTFHSESKFLVIRSRISFAFGLFPGLKFLKETLKSFALYRDTAVPLLYLKPFFERHVLGLGCGCLHQFD